MLATNYSDFRQGLKNYLDKVNDDFESIIVTRKGNKNVVVISESEYNNMMENIHVTGNKKNREWIDESLKQLRNNQVRELDELND